MTDYDALYCLVLRLQDDDNGEGLDMKLTKQSQRLAEIISEEYTDCFVVPVGTEIVESPTDSLKILDSFIFNGED